MSKTKSHEDGKRLKRVTLVSIEELLSEESFSKNGERVNLCPSTSNSFSQELVTSLSNDDFSDSTISTNSAGFKDSTFFGEEIIRRKLENAESSSVEDYDQQYSSDFETFSHEPTSGVKVSQGDHQAEEMENAVIEFIAKKVDIVKSQRMPQKLSEKTGHIASDCQSNAMKEFFKMKVANLQQNQDQQLVSKNPKESNKDDPDMKVVPSMLVNTRNVESLKIENLLCKMKKVSSAKFHMPEKCQRCKQANGVLAENAFMRTKLTQLRKHDTEERVEKHLHQNALVLIADIINSGPKPSDPPQEIWNRLLKN